MARTSAFALNSVGYYWNFVCRGIGWFLPYRYSLAVSWMWNERGAKETMIQGQEAHTAWWFLSLITAFWRPKQDFCTYEASFGYIVSSKPAWATE